MKPEAGQGVKKNQNFFLLRIFQLAKISNNKIVPRYFTPSPGPKYENWAKQKNIPLENSS